MHGEKIELTCQTRKIDDNTVTQYLIEGEIANIVVHNQADVAAIKIGKASYVEDKGGYSLQLDKGIALLTTWSTGTVNVPAKDATKKLQDVLIGNDVIIYGYPSSLGMKEVPQFDYNKPLLRKGIIANTNPNQNTIILDCPVYYWNSGWPAVEIENENWGIRYTVIGVVSQFIPFVEEWRNTKNGIINKEVSNSWYSVVVSMDKVFELIGYKK